MNDNNTSLEGLRFTDQAPEEVKRRIVVAQVGLEKLAQQAFTLGYREVKIPQFVDPYAELATPSKEEKPMPDHEDLRMTINQQASGRDEFAGRYSDVSGGHGNA